MPNMTKIASILGFTDTEEATAVEQAQEAIDEAMAKTGSASKIASLLGISEDHVRELIAYKIKGQTEQFEALTRRINITQSLASTGVFSSI